ncbi:hypothetical protein HXA34_10320 [Salipaludibacillus agaradhaerens]|uniref:hypothetical protein n=1 Tax=Salipaludibacillus agaradhaerens TaxID=76935 RepID=UPI0021515A2C|nr:hypothetical protein [Salipaludibacillus agaradhaerens]MCR6106678.1 hypothetical protein [Salipaludibacillus agaradhaerens]MCR6118711.1 hypothetical protein [Salipaludibacillus agaradhaerens]
MFYNGILSFDVINNQRHTLIAKENNKPQKSKHGVMSTVILLFLKDEQAFRRVRWATSIH